MNEEVVTKEEEILEEALKNVPDEVEDFMWSNAYTMILDAIQSTIQISDEQKETLRTKSYEVLLGTLTLKALGEELVAEGFSPEQAAKSMFLVNAELIERAKNIAEFYTPDTTDEVAPEEQVATAPQTPPAQDILESLKTKMITPSAIAPTVRQQATPLTELVKKDAAVEEKGKIDPYRELPE